MESKVIVTVALVGALTQKGEGRGKTPYAPITPDEMAEEAKRAYDAGASVVHIHARDPKTGQTYETGQSEENVECFREIVEKIRAKCPMIINITTGGGRGQTLEERLAPVPAIKPEMASFTSGVLNYGMYSRTEEKFIHDYSTPLFFKDMLEYARVFRENGTKPELEIYNHGMLNNIKIMDQPGVFEKPLHLQFVMGMPGQVTPATPRNLIRIVDSANEMFDNFTWSVAVAGIAQWRIITMAAVLGAPNIRTGLEDNLYMEAGVLAKSNGEMVEKAVSLARGVGREIASVEEAREILGLK